MCAEEKASRFYFMEVGAQGGMSYYIGELAHHAFVSSAECFGAQARLKINPRWAVQIKGQRQRVINTLDQDNDWGAVPGKYQVPMWHVDVSGEYNFFELGLDDYNIHMRSLTPYISLGVGLTVFNEYASDKDGFPKMAKGTNLDYAMYLPVGVGLKWKIADRWQLQLAWQHNVYLANGDGLEGVIVGCKGGDDPWIAYQDKYLNNSHEMNGSNIMNNDLVSTLTVGVVFEFGRREGTCMYCEYTY